ncbi:MAG: alpha/beta hydrolase [Nakamurella sp.]
MSPLRLPSIDDQTPARPDGRTEYLRVPVSGGRTMHVTVFGPPDGPATVALHGLGGSTKQNLPALDAIAEHYGLRIHAIDLPNHGRSGKVGIFEFRVRHFADLIMETISGLGIEPEVIFGHSFGGQLAAMVADAMPADSVQPIFVNPALGVPWDRKLRQCWRQPWRFFKLVEELGYNEGNIARSEFYHAGLLLRSFADMLLDRDLRPYRRLQATLALLTSFDTDGILGRLRQRGISPLVVHGVLDQSTPAGHDVHFVDGFHSWLQETSGPQALLAALDRVYPGPVRSAGPAVG